MIVKNPTDSTLSIQYKGIVYSIEPQSQLSVPTEVAEHWHTRIHEFVILEDEVVSEISTTTDGAVEVPRDLPDFEVPAGVEVVSVELSEEVVAAPTKKPAKAPKKAKVKSAK